MLAGVAGAQTNKLSLGFFTGVGSGWTNYVFAGVSTKIGIWPTAVIYDTSRTLSNNGVLGLSWDRMEAASDPFTNSYTVYYGNLDTGGPTNSLNCLTNRYAVFFNFLTTNRFFFFVRAKSLDTGEESTPSLLLIAPPIP